MQLKIKTVIKTVLILFLIYLAFAAITMFLEVTFIK